MPDTLIDPENSSPLDVRAFRSGPLASVNWRTAASGISMSDAAAELLTTAWFAQVQPSSSLGAAPDDMERTEGALQRRLVAHRSRERALRDAKLAQARRESSDDRLRCQVPGCGFDFAQIYGSAGEGYAQVHHLRPLADAIGPTTTRLEDLVVVCANCHAIIHRGGKCREISKLIVAEN